VKRYAHYYWPLKGKRYPARMAVLTGEYVLGSSSGHKHSSPEQLGSWCLLVADYRRGVLGGIVEHTGEGVRSVWTTLSQLLTSKEKVWLWIPGALRLLNAIGWKERLENDNITLAGRSWETPNTRTAAGEDKQDALCILSDPPTLVLLGIPPRPGRLLVLDTRNIGFEVSKYADDNCDYCRRALDGIHSVLSTLRQTRSGALRCTAGSQSVSILRTRYDVSRLHCGCDTRVNSLSRAGLYGGRCEAFRLGEATGPIYHLDVRNMYPALCRYLPLPVSVRRYHDERRAAEDCTYNKPENTCAHVRIRCDGARYPVRRGGIIHYPIGIFDTILAGPELSQAVKEGIVQRVFRAVEYTCAPVLSQFMTDWLAELDKARASGNVLLQQWIKRLMVSLVGKFAENGRRWIPAPRHRTEQGPYGEWTDQWEGQLTRFRNVGWRTMREEYHGESYWSIPAITAWITSAGRVQLAAYLDCARRERTLYIDTDALLVSHGAYCDLRYNGYVRDGQAGYLRLLGTHSRCCVYGYRHYSLDTTVKCSGWKRPEAGEGETEEEYNLRLAEDSIRYRTGYSGSGTRTGGRGVGNGYQHGNVLADGTVIPFEVYDE